VQCERRTEASAQARLLRPDDLPHSMLNLPGFSDPLVQNSRYKDGTTKAGSLAFSSVPYRALQCDRCLVITTRSNRSAPFHGANAGSNPAGDAKSITSERNVYSLFNKRSKNVGSMILTMV
jgi:hypothetical protein